MNEKQILLVASLLLLACPAHSSGNCRIVEYSDHVEASCIDTPAPLLAKSATTAVTPTPEVSSAVFSSKQAKGADATIPEVKDSHQSKSSSGNRQRRPAPDAIDAARESRAEKIIGGKL
jgi:hypothetical protein